MRSIQRRNKENCKIILQMGGKTFAQDYEGALTLVVPGSNGEEATKVAKESWDLGFQDYIIFINV